MAGPHSASAQSLRRALTQRYLLGLGIIACLVTLTYVVVTQRIATARDTARTVNMAGLQRMLSQRVALAAARLAHPRSPGERASATAMLRESVDRMRTDHAKLTAAAYAGTLPDSVLQLYAGERQIDRRVTEFLDAAARMLAAPPTQPAEDRDFVEAWNTTQRAEESDLLGDLNQVVSALEADARASVDHFIRLETMFYVAAMLMLVAEARLIFRPMVDCTVGSLDKVVCANIELQEFSFRISHDLRAPIASSLGLVGIASDALANDQKQPAREALASIQTAMQRLDTLINDVVNVTRSNQAEMTIEDVPLHSLIDDVFLNLRNMPDADAIGLRNNVPRDTYVTTSHIHLRQIAENLVSNGLKYHDPEKPDNYVAVNVEQTSNDLKLVVDDNGLGVPEFAREKLFSMFARFHPKVSFGTGLGLYLAQKNARALGGQLVFTPLPRGSRFTLTLPRR